MHPPLKVNVPRIGLMGLKSAFAAKRMWTAHLEDARERNATGEISTLISLLERLTYEISLVVQSSPHINLEDRRLLRQEGWMVTAMRKVW